MGERVGAVQGGVDGLGGEMDDLTQSWNKTGKSFGEGIGAVKQHMSDFGGMMDSLQTIFQAGVETLDESTRLTRRSISKSQKLLGKQMQITKN